VVVAEVVVAEVAVVVARTVNARSRRRKCAEERRLRG
jgi:hypothetical protein